MKILICSDNVTIIGHGEIPGDVAPDKIVLGKSGAILSNLALQGGTSALRAGEPGYQGPEYQAAYVATGETLVSVDSFEYFDTPISTQRA